MSPEVGLIAGTPVSASYGSTTLVPILSESCGTTGADIASEFAVCYPEGFTAQPDSVEQAEVALSGLAYLSHQLCWSITAVCYEVRANSLLQSPNDAPRRLAIEREFLDSFYSEFDAGCLSLGISALASPDESITPEAQRSRNRKAFQRFYTVYDASNGPPAGNYSAMVPRIGTLSEWWNPFLNKSTGAFCDLVPITGQAMLTAGLTTLAGRRDRVMVSACLRKSSDDEATGRDFYRKAEAMLSSASREAALDPSNLASATRRVYFAVALMVAMYQSLVASLEVLKMQTPSTGETELPRMAMPDAPLAEQSSIYALSQMQSHKVIQDAVHSNPEGWQFDTPVGVSPTPLIKTQSSVTLSDGGRRWFTEMIKLNNSQYVLPGLDEPQPVWQAWVARIAAIPGKYPNLPEDFIVDHLVATVNRDDYRIFGWSELMLTLPLGELPSVDMFLTHVRGRMLSTQTTRNTAWTDLQDLRNKIPDLSDCTMLATKLRQLFQQMYPVNQAAGDEAEPITRLKAMIVVHQMLSALKIRPDKSPIGEAWHNYDGINMAQVFIEYVHSRLHTTVDESQRLCQAYIELLVQHLQIAHEISTQLKGTVADSKPDPGKQTKLQRTVAAAKLLNISPETLSAKMGSTGKRPSNSVAAAGHKKPRQDSRPYVPYQEGGVLTRFAKAAIKTGKDDPHLQLGALRRKAGIQPDLSEGEIMKRIKSTAVTCYLCLDSHRPHECTLRKMESTQKLCSEFLLKYKRNLSRDDK